MNRKLLNNYLVKYKDTYKVFKNDTGMKILMGKFGQIEPHSKGKLVLWLRGSDEDFTELSHRKATSLIKALDPYLTHCLVMTGELSATFLEENIHSVASLLRIRKKRKLSEEQKTKLLARLSKGRTDKAKNIAVQA